MMHDVTTIAEASLALQLGGTACVERKGVMRCLRNARSGVNTVKHFDDGGSHMVTIWPAMAMIVNGEEMQ